MRIRQSVGFAPYIILAFALQAIAQPPPRGWGGGDPFYEAFREAHQANPDREILQMLHRDEVRQMIKLSDADWKEIQDTLHQVRDKMETLHDEVRNSPAVDMDELTKKIVAELAPIDKKVFGLLRGNPQKVDFDRLLGLYVQARRTRAASADQIAERIGLEGQQLEEFRARHTEKWGELMERNQAKIPSLARNPGGREKISELFQQSEKEIDDALQMQLTEEQRDRLEALKGPEVKDARRLLDFRPSGGRGGRGGGRSGDGRPGDGRGRPSDGENRGDENRGDHENRGGDRGGSR